MSLFKSTYGLVLGGGGARGGAHLGVLRVLDEIGYRPDVIVGSSIGGLIALALGAGWDVDRLEALFRETDFQDLIHLDRSGGGLIADTMLREMLEENFGGLDVRDLSPRVAVMASDVRTAERVLITEGALVEAGLATSAVPGLFPPVAWGDRLLVDGGVLDDVPTQAAYDLGVNRLIAVDVGGIIDLSTALDDLGSVSKRFERVFYWLLSLSNRQQAFDVSMRSTMITQHLLTQYELSLFPPDVLIKVEVPGIGLMAFERWEETVALGEEAARRVEPRIRAMMKRPNLLARHQQPELPPIVTVDGHPSGDGRQPGKVR